MGPPRYFHHIPHISRLMASSIDAFWICETVVIAMLAPEFHEFPGA